MSVILYDPKDFGGLANAIIREPMARESMQLPQDKLEERALKLSECDVDNRIECFFNRLYIANQLAYATTYKDECDIDGSFTIMQLQDSDVVDIPPSATTFRGKPLTTPEAILDALESIQYNIISNAGRSFFDADDSARLERLIRYYSREALRQSKRGN
jgi:hypothetical protein